LHVVPRGRFTGFIGTGGSYSLLRSRYDTTSGPTRVDFHGVTIPIEVGVGAYVTRHLALVAGFEYGFTRYVVAVLDHPSMHVGAPISALESAASEAGAGGLRDRLPRLWTATLAVRVTI
jgi:hypothetical protein